MRLLYPRISALCALAHTKVHRLAPSGATGGDDNYTMNEIHGIIGKTYAEDHSFGRKHGYGDRNPRDAGDSGHCIHRFLVKKYVFLEPDLEAGKQRAYYGISCLLIAIAFFALGKDGASMVALALIGLNICLARESLRLWGSATP